MSRRAYELQRTDVAAALAEALLTGSWTRTAMVRRVRSALAPSGPTPWVRTLVDEVLAAYRDPPADRPRELASFLTSGAAWVLAWSGESSPRVRRRVPVRTRTGLAPWPVRELPDLDALARLLDVDQGELAWFADVRGLEATCAPPLRHYTWRAVPKSNGVRLLAAPKPRLKEAQRRLLRHVLRLVPVHTAAHGGVAGRSVRTALEPHAGAELVLHLDLEAFFPSVPAGRVWGLLRTAGLPEAVAHTVTGLVTTVAPRAVWRPLPVPADPGGRESHRRLGARLATPHLPQGAPSSPQLANLVAFSLDRRLAALAAAFDARYTRYVDDLIVSGGPGLRRGRSRFLALVTRVAADEGFRVNAAKTRVLPAAGRQAALGAVLNARPTLSRPERDALRALLHNCATRGWRTQARGRDDFPAHVLGRVAWAGALDPTFGARLRSRYDAIDWT